MVSFDISLEEGTLTRERKSFGRLIALAKYFWIRRKIEEEGETGRGTSICRAERQQRIGEWRAGS